ncbi:MAG: AAA family ATPase [Alphaproteobacteria bacterium]
MDTRRIVAVTFDEAAAERMGDAVSGTAAVARVEPRADLVPQIVDTMDADMVVVDADAHQVTGESLIDIIEMIRQRAPDLPVVALGDETSAESVLAALRAGAVEFLERDGTVEEFRAALSARLQGRAARKRRGRARVTLVVSGRAQDGEGSFAMNLAVLRARAAKATGGDALLVDFEIPTGSIELALGVKAGYTLKEAVADLGRLDATMLGDAAAHHEPSGLAFLPLATEGERVRDLKGAELLSALSVLASLTDELVINGGALARSGGLRQLLALADETFVVVQQDMGSISAAAGLLRQSEIEKPEREQMRLIIADHDDDVLLDISRVADALDVKVAATLPACRRAMINASNDGAPLAIAEPAHPYVKAASRFVGGGKVDTTATDGDGVSVEQVKQVFRETFGALKARLPGQSA